MISKLQTIRISIWFGILLCLLMLCAPLLLTVRWSGGFPLAIEVKSVSNKRLAKLTADTLNGREKSKAEEMATIMVQYRGEGFAERGYHHADSKTNTIVIDIPTSGRSSGFGLFGTYSQFRWVLLGVQFESGEIHDVVVDVPDGRQLRTLTVHVP